MIITAILVAMTFAVGGVLIYSAIAYSEAKGYERGLDEAEQIICEVRNENIREHGSGEGTL